MTDNNKSILFVLFALIAGCSAKEPIEEFPASLCKYEKTNQTSSYQYQAGCSIYGTDGKGNSNGSCIAPIYATQKVRVVNVHCSKSKWVNE